MCKYVDPCHDKIVVKNKFPKKGNSKNVRKLNPLHSYPTNIITQLTQQHY